MQWTAQRFPRLEGQIRGLAQQHRDLRDEPLHLAMVYGPGRDSQDIFLFELLGNFAGNEINPDGQLFEVTFGSSNHFTLEPDQRLHLILTNPEEFRAALDQRWPTAREVRDAVRRGDFEVLHVDKIGREALELLNERTSNMAKTKKTGKAAAKVSEEQSNERASSMAATGSKGQRKRRSRP